MHMTPGRRFITTGTALLLTGALAGDHDAALAQGGSWPQFRGPNRDGRSADTNLLQQWDAGGPALAWKVSGLGAGYSSLSITADRIYTMGDLDGSQYVLALSPTDGTLLWKTKIGPAWNDRFPGPRATPTVDGALIYALGTEGDLMCLEGATGKERWHKNLARDFGGFSMSDWKYAESPLVDGDHVIVTPGSNSAALVALNKTTGATIWKAAIPAFGQGGRDGAGYSSVVVSNGGGVKQYVQLLGRGLVGIRASDGAFLWGYNRVANNIANIPTPIVSGDYVFGASGYNTGSALLKLSPAGDGKVTAAEVYFLDGRTFQNHHGGFVLVDGYIYAGQGHRNGLPICVELATGAVKWGGNIRNDGVGSAAIVYADGHVYYRYENGLVVLIEATPTGYKEKGKMQVQTSDLLAWSYPVITGGKLYLREKDSLFVYDLRKAS
jgi:outer membrane protein assembly factor BamB